MLPPLAEEVSHGVGKAGDHRLAVEEVAGREGGRRLRISLPPYVHLFAPWPHDPDQRGSACQVALRLLRHPRLVLLRRSDLDGEVGGEGVRLVGIDHWLTSGDVEPNVG